MPGTGDFILLGVDGGATEVKAHQVTCDDRGASRAFALANVSTSRVYPTRNRFRPVPVPQQLAEREAPCLTAEESVLGGMWILSAADAIVETAQRAGGRRILVGMGMPGLKTADGRGIAVINNGPRMPEYLDNLEMLLRAREVELVAPIARLGSDADYCGIGEQWAEAGLFRDVQNAYYFGGGTGVADAMKLDGRLVTFDAAKDWVRKAWQIPSERGPVFEQIVSAKSMNAGYLERLRAQGRLGQNAPDRFPEGDALAGDETAVAWLADVADALAELIVERLDTIKNGRRALPHRGADYAALGVEHPYRGTLLDRVVIGQRIGLLYADERYRTVFANCVDTAFTKRITTLGDAQLAAHVLVNGRIKPGFLRASQLRAAPALGAAVAAVHAQ